MKLTVQHEEFITPTVYKFQICRHSPSEQYVDKGFLLSIFTVVGYIILTSGSQMGVAHSICNKLLTTLTAVSSAMPVSCPDPTLS